jgi:uncharacterized membrane protein YgcG
MAFKRVLAALALLPLLLPILLCSSAFGQDLVAIPALTAHVNDHAGMLSVPSWSRHWPNTKTAAAARS